MIPQTWLPALTEAMGPVPVPLAHAGTEGFQTQEAVFDDIYLVFLVLGSLVGAVVIGYMLYNAWKYRASAADEPEDPPTLGELPTGQGGGKKLALSFTLSAIIVVGLIVWTYSALLYVDAGPPEPEGENMDVDVTGFQFGWDFTYENNRTVRNTLVIPQDHTVWLEVRSNDVWHTFGVTDLRVKADAIPGQVATDWMLAEESGVYLAECFELCGAGHSDMEADVVVLPQDEFDDWYEALGEESTDEPITDLPDYPDPEDD